MHRELLLFIVLVAPLCGQTYYARAISNGRCILPPQPAYGRYTSNILNGRPGSQHDYIVVNVTCIPGYTANGPDSSYCYDGEWVKPVPACVRPTEDRQGQGDANKSQTKCILPQHPPNGKYTSNIVRGKAGVAYDYLVVNVTCNPGYERIGDTPVHCYEGKWSGTPPTCISSGPVKEPQPLGITVPTETVSRVPVPFVNTQPTSPTTRQPINKDSTSSANSCILPEFPANGYYVTNQGSSGPGDALVIVAVTYSCRAGYILTGPALLYCYQNKWSTPFPQCVAQCRVPVHPSVEYRCLVPQKSDGESYSSGFSYRPCNEFEPSGTRVKPVCKRHYYSAIGLKLMHCDDGEWSSIKTCIPECGTLTPIGSQLVLNGTLAKHGEIPWHVAIYRTTSDPYALICGGSLISSDIVLSAAHCFWDKFLEILSSPSNYMIAAGKLYRGPNNPADQPQWSTVESIHVPKTYFGVKTSFQDDIAVVRLASPVRYQNHIRPVCLHFDAAFDNRQLRPDNKGKVAGWGLMSEDIVDGGYSRELRVVELPFVPVDTCYNAVPETFKVFLTGDKFCAGYLDAKTAVCEGDSGGGLAFPEDDRGVRRYYLRGIVSTAPTNDHDCNGDTYTTFTRVVNHENFISQYWRD